MRHKAFGFVCITNGARDKNIRLDTNIKLPCLFIPSVFLPIALKLLKTDKTKSCLSQKFV
jgi:hypothetical protein